jgi:hypothetical protein
VSDACHDDKSLLVNVTSLPNTLDRQYALEPPDGARLT